MDALIMVAVGVLSFVGGGVLALLVLRRMVRGMLAPEFAESEMRRMAKWRHPSGKGKARHRRGNGVPGIGGQRGSAESD